MFREGDVSGIMWDELTAPLKPLEHHNYMIVTDLRAILNWLAIMPRGELRGLKGPKGLMGLRGFKLEPNMVQKGLR